MIGIGEKGLIAQDFAAEKARQTEADAPKTQDTSLPGWVRLFPTRRISCHHIHSVSAHPISNDPFTSHVTQRHLVPSQRPLTQSLSSSRCPPPLPVHPTTCISPPLSHGIAYHLKTKLTTRAHGAEKEPRNPAKTPNKNQNS